MIDRLPGEVRALLREEAVHDWRAPMLATLPTKRFCDPRWVFEPKFDGGSGAWRSATPAAFGCGCCRAIANR